MAEEKNEIIVVETVRAEPDVKKTSEFAQNLKELGIAALKSAGKGALQAIVSEIAGNLGASIIDGVISMAAPEIEKVEKTGAKAAKAIGKGMLAAGGAMVDLGSSALNSAVSMDQAMNSFAASTGKGTEETDRYQSVLENIYKNNYGENFQDIADAMGDVTKRMGDMDDSALQAVTESAFVLRDTFSYDIAQSTDAAKVMMDSFGTSGEEAMSLIAAGAQNGLDNSGELLNSISAYSGEFSKVGLNADDMFNIFQTGAETGSFSMETIGNAITEMSANVLEGSDSATEGLSAIGLNAEEMTEKFAAGGESAREAFQETLDALAEMEDPLAQNAAGAELFGSAWEEMGPGVVEQLAGIADGAYDTTDAINGIKEANDGELGSMFEGMQRSVETMLVPLGEQLMPILAGIMEALMPIIEMALPPLIDMFGAFVQQLQPMIEQLLPVLTELFTELIPPISEIISAVLPVLLELADALLPIFETLIGLLAPLIDLFLDLLPPILDVISNAIVPLINAMLPLINILAVILMPIIQELGLLFGEIFGGILDTVSDVIGNITNIIKSITDFIKNVFTGNWKGAWQNIVDIFSNIIDAIGSIFKIPVNMIIDGINFFIDQLNKIKIPDWVPTIGGKGIHIEKIARLNVGMEYVPKDDFPALLHKGEAVLTAQENALYQSVGGFEGIQQALSSSAGNGDVYVNVTDTSEAAEIDYDRMGQVTASALQHLGLSIKIGEREFGRIVRGVQN